MPEGKVAALLYPPAKDWVILRHLRRGGALDKYHPNLMSLNQADVRQILTENDSERASLTCPKHRYVGSKLPPSTHGCKDCWMAYYVWDLATTPPSGRQARLDELENVIRHAVEYEQKGEFGKDLELYEPGDPRFKVSYEKDGE